MTTRIAGAMLTLATVLIATAASAQVSVTPVRPARVLPPKPVLTAPRLRLATPTVRPTVTRPASDGYRNDTRALLNDAAQPPRPSLAALAEATKRTAKPHGAPVTVQPPVRVQPPPQP